MFPSIILSCFSPFLPFDNIIESLVRGSCIACANHIFEDTLPFSILFYSPKPRSNHSRDAWIQTTLSHGKQAIPHTNTPIPFSACIDLSLRKLSHAVHCNPAIVKVSSASLSIEMSFSFRIFSMWIDTMPWLTGFLWAYHTEKLPKASRFNL